MRYRRAAIYLAYLALGGSVLHWLAFDAVLVYPGIDDTRLGSVAPGDFRADDSPLGGYARIENLLRSAPFVDFEAALPKRARHFTDVCHPTREGEQRFLESMAPALAAAL